MGRIIAPTGDLFGKSSPRVISLEGRNLLAETKRLTR